MNKTAVRRLGLLLVLTLVTLLLVLNAVYTQGLQRPPFPRPPTFPQQPAFPPQQPFQPKGIPAPPAFNPPSPFPKLIPPGTKTQTIYTCSKCGSRVSESSLSCPVC